ncbi:DUF4214 domain-containing protein [Candidatus Saccharibacteria bacterium]|nr:DUF4214 domain-containing protein [Candidatus Saccharibacteria bacterium]
MLNSKKNKKHSKPGRFTAGDGGLTTVKKFNWRRAVPIVLVISIAGGYFVFRSFAGTYGLCKAAWADNGLSGQYNKECVTNSDEAAVIRLYYGVFGRAPDASGLRYWSDKLLTKKLTLTQVAQQFTTSSEFKNKYGALSNEAFVKAMYVQIFGREPDSAGLTYWTNKLNAKTTTRESMVVSFTQSSEMKNKYVEQVSRVLAIRTFSDSEASYRYKLDARNASQLQSTPDYVRCNIYVIANDQWDNNNKQGTLDITASDQGYGQYCSSFKVTKLSVNYAVREAGTVKVEDAQSSSTVDADNSKEHENIVISIKKPNYVLRANSATLSVKDINTNTCFEYSADLLGDAATPTPLKRLSSRAC